MNKKYKSGENHPSWKGENAGYNAKHVWIRKVLGTPSRCERCKTITAKKYEWANKSRQYKRDITDWERLCVSCHRKDGYASGEYIHWNKGKHIQTNTGRTHFKKGQSAWNEGKPAPWAIGGFKKGMVPWNKYLQPKNCEKCLKQFQPRCATDANRYCSRICYWNKNK